MDDEKPLTLEWTCEEGGDGGDGEASHTAACRISTVSGSQRVGPSGRRLLTVSGKRLAIASIGHVHDCIIQAFQLFFFSPAEISWKNELKSPMKKSSLGKMQF